MTIISGPLPSAYSMMNKSRVLSDDCKHNRLKCLQNENITDFLKKFCPRAVISGNA